MVKKIHILFLFLFLFLGLSSFSVLHEFYISITSIDYNKKSKSIEITHQFIAHDVEKAILKESKIDLNLDEPNEYLKADSVLFAYILSHFNITAKNDLELKWIGREVNLDETLWVYIETSKIDKPETLVVKNTFLIDDFETQSNITHVNFGTKQQTFSFNRLNKTHTYSVK